MSLMGTNVAQSVAGLSQAERAEVRAKRPGAPDAAQRLKRDEDTDLVVVKTESADAVRSLASNDQEDAHEDRQEQPGYTHSGGLAPPAPPAQIDVNG